MSTIGGNTREAYRIDREALGFHATCLCGRLAVVEPCAGGLRWSTHLPVNVRWSKVDGEECARSLSPWTGSAP